MSTLAIARELKSLADKNKAKILSGFFKTGIGQYGAGDIFLGIVVPRQRQAAKKYLSLSLVDLQKLLNSKIHEFRLTALFILLDQYRVATSVVKGKMVKFYLANTKHINNWDLVDLSAPKILGNYLLDKDRRILYKLVKSRSIWEKRIAILATFEFIRHQQFSDALNLAKSLLADQHDLLHKAVGWMLREIGKRDLKTLEIFLKEYYRVMPRTMLRYAIEKFPEAKRQKYLKK